MFQGVLCKMTMVIKMQFVRFYALFVRGAVKMQKIRGLFLATLSFLSTGPFMCHSPLLFGEVYNRTTPMSELQIFISSQLLATLA